MPEKSPLEKFEESVVALEGASTVQNLFKAQACSHDMWGEIWLEALGGVSSAIIKQSQQFIALSDRAAIAAREVPEANEHITVEQRSRHEDQIKSRKNLARLLVGEGREAVEAAMREDIKASKRAFANIGRAV